MTATNQGRWGKLIHPPRYAMLTSATFWTAAHATSKDNISHLKCYQSCSAYISSQIPRISVPLTDRREIVMSSLLPEHRPFMSDSCCNAVICEKHLRFSGARVKPEHLKSLQYITLEQELSPYVNNGLILTEMVIYNLLKEVWKMFFVTMKSGIFAVTVYYNYGMGERNVRCLAQQTL